MRLPRFLLLLAASLLIAAPSHAVTLSAGDIVVGASAQGILKVDASTGALTSVASGFTSLGVAFAPDGRLFTTSYYEQRVAQVNPATGALTTISSGGLLTGLISLTWGPDGQIYVGTNFPRIVRVDPVSGAQQQVCASGLLANPQQLAFTPSGDLLVANYNHTILRVNVGTGAQSAYTSGGLLSVVSGLTVAGDGTVYANNITTNALVRVDAGTLTQSVVASGSPIASPRGVALDLAGQALVCSQGNGWLARVTMPSGPAAGLSPYYGMSGAYAVAVVPAGVTSARSDSWGRIKALYR